MFLFIEFFVFNEIDFIFLVLFFAFLHWIDKRIVFSVNEYNVKFLYNIIWFLAISFSYVPISCIPFHCKWEVINLFNLHHFIIINFIPHPIGQQKVFILLCVPSTSNVSNVVKTKIDQHRAWTNIRRSIRIFRVTLFSFSFIPLLFQINISFFGRRGFAIAIIVIFNYVTNVCITVNAFCFFQCTILNTFFIIFNEFLRQLVSLCFLDVSQILFFLYIVYKLRDKFY